MLLESQTFRLDLIPTVIEKAYIVIMFGRKVYRNKTELLDVWKWVDERTNELMDEYVLERINQGLCPYT